MSVQLLDKTRKINKVLHNNPLSILNFNELSQILSEVLKSSVLIFSKKGKLLGIGCFSEVAILNEFVDMKVNDYLESDFNDRLLEILSTKENVKLDTLGFEVIPERKHQGIIVPIEIAKERFGTLFIYKDENDYGIEDIIISEYGATIYGLEMRRSVTEESQTSVRNENMLDIAINTLSFSELQAGISVINKLNNKEGLIVASKIADRIGITRSVIVNALRKLESGGVIKTKSAGMKGTFIKVENDLLEEKLKNKLEEYKKG